VNASMQLRPAFGADIHVSRRRRVNDYTLSPDADADYASDRNEPQLSQTITYKQVKTSLLKEDATDLLSE